MGAAFAVFPCVQQHFCALFSAVAQTPVMASAAVLLRFGAVSVYDGARWVGGLFFFVDRARIGSGFYRFGGACRGIADDPAGVVRWGCDVHGPIGEYNY